MDVGTDGGRHAGLHLSRGERPVEGMPKLALPHAIGAEHGLAERVFEQRRGRGHAESRAVEQYGQAVRAPGDKPGLRLRNPGDRLVLLERFEHRVGVVGESLQLHSTPQRKPDAAVIMHWTAPRLETMAVFDSIA